MIVYAIDDERIMLEALTDAIKKTVPSAEVKGFRFEDELFDEFEKNPCDIVFLDIQMPGSDGIAIAKKLSEKKKDINIVFMTGYEKYKGDAMDIHASDYLTKPVTADKIKEAMGNLRHPVEIPKRRISAVTFGNFALYVDGKPVTFHRKKSAELLAYLICKGGTVVSRRELTLMLYEDEIHSLQSRKLLDNAIRTLKNDLTAVNASDIFYCRSDGLAVNRDGLEADLFVYKKGDKKTFDGEFLEQYPWSEYFRNLL